MTYPLAFTAISLSLASSLFAQLDGNTAAPDHWKQPAPAEKVRPDFLTAADDLEVTLWAESPLLFNPTNIDVDTEGRIWVAEGVNYRSHKGRRQGGDRIAVLQDTDGDGRADKSHTFVQEKALIAPLGVTVLDNKVIVPQPPHMLVYTDVNRNLVFEPGIDTREEFLGGFNAANHDHSLHALIPGPDGKWYVNNGNCGAIFTDKDGKTFRMRSPYHSGGQYFTDSHKNPEIPSDDGYHYNAGFIARLNPDGTGTEIVGQGFRNSYEHCVNSFGEMFQSDNDDPPACRVSYILEYGDAGFFSKDGKYIWSIDRRPGQSTQVAHWRQESPGTMDVGDVYGTGSPTGVAFYENGALPEKWRGTLLACEPGRNLIFYYHPKEKGGSYELKRHTFLGSSNGKTTSDGRRIRAEGEKLERLQFRPSDAVVGVDGAIYVADWYDRRVGGHGDVDESCSGAIYRIAPKGFRPKIPAIDRDTVEGAVTALRSPSPSVRYLGFQLIKKQGDAALPALQQLLADKNPYLAARAIWLLPHCGGLADLEQLLQHKSARFRLTAMRSLRAANRLTISHLQSLVSGQSPAIHRDVALALRSYPLTEKTPLLLKIYQQWDGEDQNTLEAIGIAVTNQETDFYAAAKAALKPGEALQWDKKFTKLTWRFTPETEVSGLLQRAQNPAFDPAARKFALETIGFINSKEAFQAMTQLYENPVDPAQKKLARWWLKNRAFGAWRDLGAYEYIASSGIYDPNAPISASPIPVSPPEKLLKVADVLKLTGNPTTGKTTAMRCVMCHKIGEFGVNYGPELTNWGKTQPLETIVRAIVEPSADIAHGYFGQELKTKEGQIIHGLIRGRNERETTIISQGGLKQTIAANRIKHIRPLKTRSVMLSADRLGLTEQDVADIAAYLQNGAE